MGSVWEVAQLHPPPVNRYPLEQRPEIGCSGISGSSPCRVGRAHEEGRVNAEVNFHRSAARRAACPDPPTPVRAWQQSTQNPLVGRQSKP